jgi:lipopolysaccharide/colanic/teichoic acid biosynthesis glycosyltransferase
LSLLNAANMKSLESSWSATNAEREVLSEEGFRRRIAIERKRTERSREPFLLMLLESAEQPTPAKQARLLERMMVAVAPTTRETDSIGWYRDGAVIGVLFTGLADEEKLTSRTIILNRVTTRLREDLPDEQVSQITITFHFFPDDWGAEGLDASGNPILYPDLVEPDKKKRAMLGLKRFTDVAGGILLLILALPLLLVVAAAVKMTSKGPVFFRQPRVGQYGRRFTFLKFRSMYANNDPSVHREYVRKLIAGTAERVTPDGKNEGVFKLANDRRITPLGKFLRRTSLDELPQLLNVIRGDMSLVGPRPPLPYELAAYQTWHRRRLLLVKPGITGLWQVKGRSRVTFEDMVRLDLQYATAWSPWLDVKILLLTPGAVIKGAY